MLKLIKIVKDYVTGEDVVRALKGVNLDFRKSEFVSILGPSGCGKTTLLNIIGGLDKYTSGDLIINGRSTKDFNDKDWDTYRNHSIGFVFQSYNLIPHQTVLENVELALTLSGVSKKERKERAKKALEQVGLKDQIKKRPNQLSGGQMQRVAIARALVNDPEIILADEPTGALDTETSVQIMDILKEISKEKLIIMVTHNPELADTYSNRIIKLVDGVVIDDSNPYVSTDEDIIKDNVVNDKSKKTSMSFFTALSLSMKNLFTKKARTILTSFAGSIGIIGIATILSLSSGFDNYISKVEEDTLSTYPISIQYQNMDMMSTFNDLFGENDIENPEKETVYVNDVMGKMITSMSKGIKTNDLKSFKNYIENNQSEWDKYSYVQYMYDIELNAYNSDYSEGIEQVAPFKIDAATQAILSAAGFSASNIETMMQSMPAWTEMIDNQDLLKSQYDIYGDWPSSANEVVLVVDGKNSINDFALCALGLENFGDILLSSINTSDTTQSMKTYKFNELINRSFYVVPSSGYYADIDNNGIFEDLRKTNPNALNETLKEAFKDRNKSIEVKISGIVKLKENVATGSINGIIGYTHDLATELIDMSNESIIVKAQEKTKDINVLTGQPFAGFVDTYEINMTSFGQRDKSSPHTINIYPRSFEDKQNIEVLIKDYNDGKSEDDQISYNDFVGDMMKSISTIINAISYVLIGFVSISLVVSSIMIGIITYISVLERTKEIGVLRAIGASKKDVSRVFNAETLLIGLVSGVLGITVTLGIDLIINIILEALVTDISGIAVLPFGGAIILILISVVLTMIAGLIPAKLAAKKDPVIALRTE